MLRVPTKSRLPRRLIYGVVAGEVLLFMGCFAGFRRLLYDRDARLYCRDNYPTILKQFYWVLSLDKNPASNTLHLVDEEIWTSRK